MRRVAKLSVIGLTIALACLPCAPVEGAALGRLRGVVMDQTGAPLVGATVAIFDVASAIDKPIRSARTDDKGRFVAAVAPGRYLLRALATGFSSVEARALVAADRETVIDSFALRRVNTLADRRRAENDSPYRNVARRARGHVFHVDESDENTQDLADAQAMALTEERNRSHGVVQSFAASGEFDYLGTNFALTRSIAKTDVTIVGQTGVGDGAPQRLEIGAERDFGQHTLNATFGYGRAPVRRSGTDGDAVNALDQFTVQVEDRWQVSGPLVLVYGLNATKFSGQSEATSVLPRLGVEFSPTNRTQLFAGFTPGSTLDEIASFDLETGDVTFVAPQETATARGSQGAAIPDRSRRFQVGVGHLINERSNIEVMAFFDTVSGKGVGFLSVPADGADAEFSTGTLDGETNGMRVVYRCRLTKVLTGTAGYAFGTGMHLGDDPIANPASFYRSGTYQVFAGQLQADFDSGTRVTAVYRHSPRAVVFAIDPFADRLAASSPTSLVVAQAFRMPWLIPGQWEAMLDIRNLFDTRPTSDDGEIILRDYSRLVRAGLSFRF